MPGDKILLVESNPRIVEMLVDSFVRRFNCNITCVAGGEDALDVEMLEPHSIIVADCNLTGMDPITFTERMAELHDRPVILMDNEPTAGLVIEAMRHGVVDFFCKPFEVESLLQSMTRAMARHRETRARIQRYHKGRDLMRRVIRERRELNDRVELICRDLVGAHKRLVLRVLEQEERDAPSKPAVI
jgi:DNA-binding NtrC family response regulator